MTKLFTSATARSSSHFVKDVFQAPSQNVAISTELFRTFQHNCIGFRTFPHISTELLRTVHCINGMIRLFKCVLAKSSLYFIWYRGRISGALSDRNDFDRTFTHISVQLYRFPNFPAQFDRTFTHISSDGSPTRGHCCNSLDG